MITLDGKPLEEYGLFLLKGHTHPSPQITNKTMKIPGRPGLYHFGSEVGARPFSHPVGVLQESPFETQRKIRAFNDILFDAFGNTREIELKYEYEPDKYYSVVFDGSIVPERAFEYAEFQLPLVANDPHAYAAANQYDPADDVLYGEVMEGNYYDNPQSFDWIYPKHYSGINNYSPLNTDFIIEISGTVTNPSVTNLVNDKRLTLPSITNGKLVIDGKRFVVIKNGQDILGGSNYNFFFIQPGEVGFLFEGEKPNAIVTYRWLHKFM